MSLRITVETDQGAIEIPLKVRSAREQAHLWEADEEGVDYAFDRGAWRYLNPSREAPDLLAVLARSGARPAAVHFETLDAAQAVPGAVLLLAETLDAGGDVLGRAILDLAVAGLRARVDVAAAAARLRLRVRLSDAGRFRNVRLRVGDKAGPASSAVEASPVRDWLDLAPRPMRAILADSLLAGHIAGLGGEARSLAAHVEALGRLVGSLPRLGADGETPLPRLAREIGNGLAELQPALEALQHALPPVLRKSQAVRDALDVPARTAPAPAAPADDVPEGPEPPALAVYRDQGEAAAIAWCLSAAPPPERAERLYLLSDALRGLDREAAVRLAWLAFLQNPAASRLRILAARLFHAGELTQLQPVLRHDPAGANTAFMGEIWQAVHLWTEEIKVPARRPSTPPDQGVEVAYVATGALPLYISGYTTRTHQILRSLNAAGVSCRGLTRPGFPWDRSALIPAEGVGETAYRLDGVDYVYTRCPDITPDPERHVWRLSRALELRCREIGARLVHAASNQRNALPALFAARRLGLPFIYEVRGLWELNAAARMPGWELTDRFALERRLETLVATEADHVLTITQGVAEELIAGGVPRERISLLPNAVDPAEFAPMKRSRELAAKYGLGSRDFVLVYAGSLTVYEGLDDLVTAIGLLRARGAPARLIIAGTGPMAEPLQRQVAAAGLGEAIRFVGRIEPDDIRRHLSLADAVALPRKPLPICEIVSPLKPFEAMAMGKPVVLSDLAALREIVVHEERGLLCKPADPLDLADVLGRLAADKDLRRRLGDAGRDWVLSSRTWAANAQILRTLYDRLLANTAVTAP